MHEFLVHTGAGTSLDADRHYRVQGLASVSFDTEVKHVWNGPDIITEVASTSLVAGSIHSGSTDRTSLVPDSQNGPSQTTTRLNPEPDLHTALVSDQDIIEKCSARTRTIQEVCATSCKQFSHHEKCKRDSERLPYQAASIIDRASDDIQNRCRKALDRPENGVNQVALSHTIEESWSTFVVEAGEYNALELKAPETMILVDSAKAAVPMDKYPSTPLDAVKQRARNAAIDRTAALSRNVQMRLQASNATIRSPVCHFQHVPKLHTRKTSLELGTRTCTDIAPKTDNISTAPSCSVNRVITIANDEEHGKECTPVFDEETIRSNNSSSCSKLGGSDVAMIERPTQSGRPRHREVQRNFKDLRGLPDREAPVISDAVSPRVTECFASVNTNIPGYPTRYTDQSLAQILDAPVVNYSTSAKIRSRSTTTKRKSSKQVDLDYSRCVERKYRDGSKLLTAVMPPEAGTANFMIPDFLASLKPTRPPSLVRALDSTERGHWSIGLKDLGFDMQETKDFWDQLGRTLIREEIHWVSAQFFGNSLRIYCYANCALQVWMLLYALPRRKLLKRPIPWIDALGRTVMLYP